MKKHRTILFLICAIFLFGACSQQTTSSPATAASTAPGSSAGPAKIPSMEIITGTATGSWVPIGSGIAEKFNEFYDGFPATAVPGPGSMGNPPMIAAGDGEIGMSYAPFLVNAVNGSEPYEEALPNLRAVAALQPTVFHWRVDSNAEIDNVSQFAEGKSKMVLGMPPMGNANYYLVKMIYDQLGMSIEKMEDYGIKIYFAESAGLTEAWKNRQIDSSTNILNVPAADITESFTGRGGKLLQINGDLREALKAKFGFEDYTIPAGTYPGQEQDVETVALRLIVFVRDEMDEQMVYNLTKAIYENTQYFETVHSSFREFDRDTMSQGVGIELHPGAIRFYQEIGQFQ